MSIKFGLWSTVLLVGSIHGLIVACLLWRAHANRLANRALAGLLLAVVLMITPYTLGYAGAYDAWPWLTFAPFFWQLGFGPLLWIYVRQLGEPSMPRRWALHFVPVAIQGGYYMVLFVHPTAWKWARSDTIQDPYVMPLQNGLLGLSLMTYWGAALTRYRRWQQWLEANSGAREEFRLRWLRTSVLDVALAVGFGSKATFNRVFLAEIGLTPTAWRSRRPEGLKS